MGVLSPRTSGSDLAWGLVSVEESRRGRQGGPSSHMTSLQRAECGQSHDRRKSTRRRGRRRPSTSRGQRPGTDPSPGALGGTQSRPCLDLEPLASELSKQTCAVWSPAGVGTVQQPSQTWRPPAPCTPHRPPPPPVCPRGAWAWTSAQPSEARPPCSALGSPLCPHCHPLAQGAGGVAWP